jgi:hypothetical protein
LGKLSVFSESDFFDELQADICRKEAIIRLSVFVTDIKIGLKYLIIKLRLIILTQTIKLAGRITPILFSF